MCQPACRLTLWKYANWKDGKYLQTPDYKIKVTFLMRVDQPQENCTMHGNIPWTMDIAKGGDNGNVNLTKAQTMAMSKAVGKMKNPKELIQGQFKKPNYSNSLERAAVTLCNKKGSC